MKKSALLAMLLSAMFAVGCQSMKSDSGSKSTSGSTGQAVDDATITTKVKSALLADSEISALKINVDTAQGRVKLKGEVKTLAQRKRVEELARGVSGVKSVDNQLVITG